MKKRLRKKMDKMKYSATHIDEKRHYGTVSGELSEQIKDYEMLLQRLKADFDNYKKRSAKEHLRAGDAGKKDFLEKLLEVYDSMELALKKDGGESEEINSFIDGLQMIHNRLDEIIQQEGVSVISPDHGDEFNPEIHDAVSVEKTDNENEAGRIAQQIKKGFKYKEWLLRPAKVAVFQYSNN